MAASYETVLTRITDVVNIQTPGTWSSTVASTNLDRNAQAITEAVREAAMMIARAILANPTHVHRNLFVSGTPTSLTHGSELPDMAGESDLIEIQPYSGASWFTGVPKTPQQIDSFRDNPSNLYGTTHTTQGSPLAGYYAIDNGRVKFTGYAARIYVPAIDRTTVTGLIPDEYEPTWVKLGAGLCLKEGDNLLPIGSTYYNWGLQDLGLITEMSVVPPMKQISAHGDA